MQKWEEIEQKKEYLEGYINSKNREALIKDQIQQLRLDTMFPALQGDGIPRGSSQKDLSDYTAKIESLMEELKKINRIIDKEYPEAYRETLVVLDGTTGQNALVQARQFMEAADITGIILTKLDGTAKGGIAVAIQSELGIPVKYVGVGEKIDDLQKFNSEDFVNALFAKQPE